MADYSHLQGYVYRPDAVAHYQASLAYRSFGEAAPIVAGAGKGQTRLLYEYVRKVYGKDFGEIQDIGDCVPHGWQRGIVHLWCIRIALNGKQEKFPGIPATEAAYALMRHEIGKDQLGRGDGGVGAWQAKALMQYGILFRQKYGSIDLTTYSGSRARDWGMPGRGLPDELEPIARETPIQDVAPVTTYEEARDAIYSGFPVVVCSGQGFASTRDKDGFLHPQGSWSHCMLFSAVDDNPKRPGLLCDNRSWPDSWVSGPKKLNAPEGAGWVDASVADRMLSRMSDSYAITDVKGFPDQTGELDYVLI